MEPSECKSFLPINWSYAFGHNVWDNDNREYLDFTSGIFVANVGHGNLTVRESVRNVSLYHAYNYRTKERDQYVKAITEKTGYEAVALFSSGTEAVEAALRVMRANKAGPIMRIEGCFHGRTQGARLEAKQDGCEHSDYLCGMSNNVIECFFPSGYVRLPDGLAGIILEGYRGWDARFYPQEFIDGLMEYKAVNPDFLICFDEIQSGFGRTGRFFAHEHYGIRPDLVCIGKAMGGGLPMSGLLSGMDLISLPGDLTSTHSGNPLSCSAGLAVLAEIDRLDLVEEAARKGRILKENLPDEGLMVGNLGSDEPEYYYEVNGKGLVAAIMTSDNEEADAIVTKCYEHGLLVVHTGRNSVKIGPPLTISDEALNEGIDILLGVLCDGYLRSVYFV